VRRTIIESKNERVCLNLGVRLGHFLSGEIL
jgi:hypothetical protein